MRKPDEAPTRRSVRRSWMTRRIWLPGPLYEALPWLYCVLGGAALAAGLFLPQPTWLLPYLFLLAVTGIHVGLWCALLRRRYRCRRLRQYRARRTLVRGASPGPAAM